MVVAGWLLWVGERESECYWCPETMAMVSGEEGYCYCSWRQVVRYCLSVTGLWRGVLRTVAVARMGEKSLMITVDCRGEKIP